MNKVIECGAGSECAHPREGTAGNKYPRLIPLPTIQVKFFPIEFGDPKCLLKNAPVWVCSPECAAAVANRWQRMRDYLLGT